MDTSASGVIYQSWLNVKKKGSYKRLWTVLRRVENSTRCALECYQTEKLKKVVDKIDLRLAEGTKRRSPEAKTKDKQLHCFDLFLSGDKICQCAAFAEETLEKWLKKLERAGIRQVDKVEQEFQARVFPNDASRQLETSIGNHSICDQFVILSITDTHATMKDDVTEETIVSWHLLQLGPVAEVSADGDKAVTVALNCGDEKLREVVFLTPHASQLAKMIRIRVSKLMTLTLSQRIEPTAKTTGASMAKLSLGIVEKPPVPPPRQPDYEADDDDDDDDYGPREDCGYIKDYDISSIHKVTPSGNYIHSSELASVPPRSTSVSESLDKGSDVFSDSPGSDYLDLTSPTGYEDSGYLKLQDDSSVFSQMCSSPPSSPQLSGLARTLPIPPKSTSTRPPPPLPHRSLSDCSSPPPNRPRSPLLNALPPPISHRPALDSSTPPPIQRYASPLSTDGFSGENSPPLPPRSPKPGRPPPIPRRSTVEGERPGAMKAYTGYRPESPRPFINDPLHRPARRSQLVSREIDAMGLPIRAAATYVNDRRGGHQRSLSSSSAPSPPLPQRKMLSPTTMTPPLPPPPLPPPRHVLSPPLPERKVRTLPRKVHTLPDRTTNNYAFDSYPNVIERRSSMIKQTAFSSFGNYDDVDDDDDYAKVKDYAEILT